MREILERLDLLIKNYPGECYFNDPASDESIANMEEQNNIKLPLSYIHFLKCYNGGFISLFKNHSGIDPDSLAWNSNNLLSIEMVNSLFDRINIKTYGDEIKFIPIIHTTSGEHLGFRYPLEADGESKVYDLWHEAPASEWADSVVYDNFTDLLDDYISGKGIIETM